MALVGKWTKIEKKESETEKEIVTVSYPKDLPQDHPSFDKAGTTEKIEVPKIDTLETVFDDVYVVVHSVNSWKQIIDAENKTLFNVCFRVYESKDHRVNNYDYFVFEDHIIGQEMDYNINKNEIQQAYSVINTKQGFEELIND